MITAAFDASGHPSDQEFLVVAGFVSSARDWISFSLEWNERLRMSGMRYLHSTEIFKQIPSAREQQGLLGDLIAIIRRYAYRKFGLATLTRDLTGKISKQRREALHISEYSLAGLSCARQVVEWWGKSERMVSSPMQFVFEEGDIGRGKLKDLFEASGLPEPMFLPGKKMKLTPSGVPRYPFVPLQAADLLAREFFMFVCDEAEKQAGRAPKRRVRRWLFDEFDRIPGSIFAIDMPAAKMFEPVLAASEYLRSVQEAPELDG